MQQGWSRLADVPKLARVEFVMALRRLLAWKACASWVGLCKYFKMGAVEFGSPPA